jgi:hypothetical protein
LRRKSKSVKTESSEHTNEVQSDNMFPNDFQAISLLNKVFPPKWYTKVHIIVAKDYSFDAIFSTSFFKIYFADLQSILKRNFD